MKSLRYQRRFYRDWVRIKDLHLTQIIAKETDLQILTNKKLDRPFVEEKIQQYRWDIENYINKDHRFLTALKPLAVELNAQPIILAMAEAARQVSVGPMACVAGAIAEFLGKELLKKGYKDVIVENGGDVFLKISKTRVIGLYTGKSKVWNKLGLVIKPSQTPLGICTSSGTIGHSLSFGSADSVVILSKSTLLSDAVATAVANRVNSKKDMDGALNFARAVKAVEGVIIILKKDMMSWGKLSFSPSAKKKK